MPEDAAIRRIVVRIPGSPFNPTYETDDASIGVGDTVVIPGSAGGFYEDGETGTVIAVGSDYAGPCKRVTRA